MPHETLHLLRRAAREFDAERDPSVMTHDDSAIDLQMR
jgi:hypothetical protein